MKYKLIAVDVDGTLLNSQKQVTEKTIQTVRQAVEKGAVFCISSGRPIYAADTFSKLFGIPDMPFILYNGALTVTGADHKVLIDQGLSPDTVRYLIYKGNEFGTTIIVWAGNQLYVNEINERTDKYQTLSNIPPILITSIDEVVSKGVSKVLWYDTLQRMPDLKNFLENCEYRDKINFFTSNPLFMEIVDKHCSKATALEMLAAFYGIDREEIIAIGDGYNDLPMLEYAGLGIAMGNAPEEIKNRANAVTASNDEDGVAKAIEKYILNEQ